MKLACRSFTCLCAVALLLAFGHPVQAQRSAAGAGAPTLADVQADYDAGRYQDVIRKVQLLINGRGGINSRGRNNSSAAPAEPAGNVFSGVGARGAGAAAGNAESERTKLLQLKAEAHLQLKQMIPAADAYTAAAKEATDPKDQSMDKAMALLLKRSPGAHYTPRQPVPSTLPGAEAPAAGAGPRTPIDIIDPTSRKEALLALFNDEFHTAAPRLESLGRQQSLPPLLNGIKQVADLRGLEMAATGSSKQSAQLLTGLGDQAAALIESWIKQQSAQVDRIAENANKMTQLPGTVNGNESQMITVKQGLNSSEASTLGEIKDTAEQLAEVCQTTAESLQSSGSKFASVGSEAKQLAVRIDSLLKSDYGQSTARPMPEEEGTTTIRGGNSYGNQNQNQNRNPIQRGAARQVNPPVNNGDGND